jgi:hypothetical protein
MVSVGYARIQSLLRSPAFPHSDVHRRVRVLGFGLQAGRNGSVIEVARIESKIDIQDDEGSRGAWLGARARVGRSKMVGTIVAGLLVLSSIVFSS